MLSSVIGCNLDKDHRPLRPMLTPKGIRVAATVSRDLRGFCIGGRRKAQCFTSLEPFFLLSLGLSGIDRVSLTSMGGRGGL